MEILSTALKHSTLKSYHSISLPHIEGYLYKWTNLFRGWQKRYFVLAHGVLMYFNDPKLGICRGAFNLLTSDVLKDPDHTNTIIIKSGTYRFYLRSESEDTEDRWIELLHQSQAILVQIALADSQFSLLNLKAILRDVREANLDLEREYSSLPLDIRPELLEKATRFKSTATKLVRLIEDMEAVCDPRATSRVASPNKLQLALAPKRKTKHRRSSSTEIYYDLEEEPQGEFEKELDGIKESPRDESESESDVLEMDLSVECSLQSGIVTRRERLPLEISSTTIKFNIIEIIKEAAGKDITRVTFPASVCEPISFLQKCAEEFQYAHLLTQAASHKDDPLLRMVYVAAWAVASYSSTEGRMKKPFNPLLGETFEVVDVKGGYRFLAEQVSHHPPATAVHAESEHYTFWTDVIIKNKFWGNSLEVTPQGLLNLWFKDGNDHFVWNKVTTLVSNLFFGSPVLEHFGTMDIINKTTGDKCVIEFQKDSGSSWFGGNKGSKNVIRGVVKNKNNQTIYQLNGWWNKELLVTNSSSSHSFQVWQPSPKPDFSSTQFDFSSHTIFLNQLHDLHPSSSALPPAPTDSRFRPDSRALENGNVSLAGLEKHRIEEKQRAVRKAREGAKETWDPRWFEKQTHNTNNTNAPNNHGTHHETWRYKGGYWEAKDKQTFHHSPDLW
eukprot:TRINITY_DN8208_c0_g1_i1.p1 TRINITY_DN8208_c0_g1~~TRINITY_DN8208_c0_g1_i1.p1  ORF type:complete len:670 (-),score=130.01 TRINITY_DN8208_c0_g1_i1:129-2138(-)